MPKAKPANGIAADIAAMERLGMTPAEIKAKIMGGPAFTAVPPPTSGPMAPRQDLTAPQRQDQKNLGPDPEVVARHQAAVAAMPKAVLEETFDVTLKRRYVDYVRWYAALTNAKRPNSLPINEAKAIELIVMDHKRLNPDAALMASGGSMSRQAFNETVAPLIPKTA